MKLTSLIIALGLLAAPPVHANQPYIVMDGYRVDSQTYNGFRLFRNWCARCHGTFAQGLAGPSLAENLNRIGKMQFMEIVENGKTGQYGVMPAWSSNTQVMEGREDIYRYLKARADGVLGEVRPELAQ